MSGEGAIERLARGAAAGAAGTMAIQGPLTATRKRLPDLMPPTREDPGEFMANKVDQAFPMEASARQPTAAAKSLAVDYGPTAGAACAALRRGRSGVLVDGTALGLGTWAAGYVGWLPATGPLVVFLAVLLAGLLSSTVSPVPAGEKPVAVVEVKVFEHRIEMLAAVPPGATTFRVTNAGTVEHNFEVESKDLEKKFDSNLKPGETKSLQVDLAPGKYTVYCPVENHKALGMQLELTVAEQRTD